jgi:hypothetical protein
MFWRFIILPIVTQKQVYGNSIRRWDDKRKIEKYLTACVKFDISYMELASAKKYVFSYKGELK